MRLGILGGTFDPIHRGHLSFAAAVRDRFDVSRVLLVPARMPPHKADEPMSPWPHRFAMTAVGCLELDRVEASPLEGSRSGPSYTVETLARLRSQAGPDAPLLFLMGSDSLAELPSWKDHRRILELAHLVVAPRTGADRSAAAAALGEEAKDRVVDSSLEFRTEPGKLAPAGMIFWTDFAADEVSGSDIRRRARDGSPIRGLVPESVEAYILKYGLYSGRRLFPTT